MADNYIMFDGAIEDNMRISFIHEYRAGVKRTDGTLYISVTAKIYTHMVDEVFEQNRKRLAEYAIFKEQNKANE